MIRFVLLSFTVLLVCCTNNQKGESEKKVESSSEKLEATKPPQTNQNATPVSSNVANRQTIVLEWPNVKAKAGESTCIDVLVRDFTDMLSMQYTMSWDKNILTYEGVKAFNLPSFGKESFGDRFVDQGFLTTLWLDQNLKGLTLENGSSIYQVCFKVIGKSGDKSTLGFTKNPTPFEAVNKKEELVNIKPVAGSLTVE